MRGGRSEKLAEILHPEQLEKTQNLNLTPQPHPVLPLQGDPCRDLGALLEQGCKSSRVGCGQESDCGHLKGHREGVVGEQVPPTCSQVSGQRHSLGRAS